jgi:hypothetical protein
MMNKTRILIVLFVLFFLSVSATIAASAEIDWWNIGGGGNLVTQDNLKLEGVLGLGMVEMTSQSGMELCSGYLCLPASLKVFLPLVNKSNP